MADRVQRFCYSSLLDIAGAVLTPDSEVTSLPRGFLLDPAPTAVWRSATGWVIDARNNKIDFNRGGVLVATVASGTYATAAALAAAIVTALEAADATPAWACTYDSGTKKFTISTTAHSFTLLFFSGTNWPNSIATSIGFTEADTSSATSHTAPNVSYQSTHCMNLDALSAQAVTVGIALNHNCGSGGTITLQGSDTDNASIGYRAISPSIDFTQVLAAAGGSTSRRIAFFASQSYRYWRLLIEDGTNTAGYNEVGIWFPGTYFQPARSYAQGNVQAADRLSLNIRAEAGAIAQLQRNQPKRHSGVFRGLSRADRDAWVAMEDAVRAKHLFFAMDAANYPDTETIYGAFEGTSPIEQRIGEGSPPDRFNVPFAFVEDLG
jgi:hypothetical protein